MAGLVMGGLITGKAKKLSSRAQVLTAYLCMGAALIIASVVPSVWFLVPAWLIGGVGNGMMAGNLHVILNLDVPDAHRGRAFSALNMVSNAAPMTGYLLGGLLLAAAGPRLSYLVIGVLACLCALASAPLVLADGRKQPITASPAAGTASAV
jgi:MFS family permease